MRQPKALPVVLLLLFSSLVPAATVDVDRADIVRVGTNIVCTCGSSGCPPTHLVSHCTCDRAQEMQREIANLLAAGKTDQEIYDYYVAQFGQTVMAAPDAEGFNLVGWISPFVVALLGMAIVWLAYRKLRTQQVPAPVATGSAAQVDDKYRDLLRREMEE